MDVDLKGLLDQIQREGVEKAKAEAEVIVQEAKTQAAALVCEAQTQAERHHQQVKAEIQRQEDSSKAALIQAGRDLLILAERKLTSMMQALLQQAVSEALSPAFLEKILLKTVEGWKTDSVRVEIPAADAAQLEAALKNKLAERFRAGCDVVLSDRFTKGFRVGTRDGALFYDFTPATLAEVLGEMVSPHLAEVLKKAAG